jgi:hypothetical protein
MFDEYYKFKGSSLYIFLHTNFVSSFLAPKLPTFNKHHRFAEVGDIYFATARRITFWRSAFFYRFNQVQAVLLQVSHIFYLSGF